MPPDPERPERTSPDAERSGRTSPGPERSDRTPLALLRRAVRWIGRQDTVALGAALLIVLSLWAFAEIADEVMDQDIQSFDVWVVRSLRTPGDPSNPVGPPWVEEVARDLTALGGVAVLGLASLAALGYLLVARKLHAFWFFLIATTGGWAISTGLKYAFGRARPDIVPHLSYVATPSFPSGHSMLSAVTYLTLGALLAALAPRRLLKGYIMAAALFLTFLVGLSRVFMGVHYLTDVLAGWAGGLAWALLCWLVFRYMQRRGKVEKGS